MSRAAGVWRSLTSSRRRLWRVTIAVVSAVSGYVGLVAHPQPLFAQSLQRRNIVLHARQPLPAQTATLLDDVLRRLERSPLYDPRREQHVFLCDTKALFALFTLHQWRSGGVANTWLNGNVFIRPSSIERGRVIGHSGAEKGGQRTLAYYVAHEVTHAMTADHIGRLAYARLAAFQVEGYADYVAFAEPVDVQRGRRNLLARTRDMNPALSGHYDRYRLLVGYLLQARGMSVSELLAERRERTEVEASLQAFEPQMTPSDRP